MLTHDDEQAEAPQAIVEISKNRPRYRYQARRDHDEIEQMKASYPCFADIERFLKQVSEMLAASGEFLRVPEKAAVLALIHEFAPRVAGQQRQRVARIFARTKEAGICWFCNFFPHLSSMNVALVASLAWKRLDPYRKRAFGVVPLRRKRERVPKSAPATVPDPVQQDPKQEPAAEQEIFWSPCEFDCFDDYEYAAD
jgi:hypothetical protein